MAEKKEKKSLSNVVYSHLKEKILNNELLPGDKLIEMDIAKELEVSRTPVRDALVKLSKDGLAENFPRKSYIVSKISMRDARDLYTVRAALEPIVIKEVAEEGITERTQELQNIISVLDRAYENNDVETVKEQLVNWSSTIITLSKNKILRDTLVLTNKKLYRFANFIFRDDENVEHIYEVTKKIYNSIVEQNSELAYEISSKYTAGIYPMLESQSDFKMFRF